MKPLFASAPYSLEPSFFIFFFAAATATATTTTAQKPEKRQLQKSPLSLQ